MCAYMATEHFPFSHPPCVCKGVCVCVCTLAHITLKLQQGDIRNVGQNATENVLALHFLLYFRLHKQTSFECMGVTGSSV